MWEQPVVALNNPHDKLLTSIILSPTQKNPTMLMTVAVVLLILWALGLVTSTTLGGFIHVLLVIAIIVVLIRVIQGKKIL
jgi:Family of unknown function (DUF5670)